MISLRDTIAFPAGIDPVDGVLDDNDLILGGDNSFIKSITIGGTTDAQSRYAAGRYPKTVSINRQRLDPTLAAGFLPPL